MASQGPLSAGTGASSGSPAWGNPTRIVASDDSRTTVNSLASLATTGTLASSQHGFSIPSGATIDGILVEIERHGTSGASDGIEDSSIRLATGGAAVGSNKATTTTWPSVGVEAYASYGGSADTWGRSWTVAEINASTFGVQIVAVNTDAAARDVRVDHIRITVTYTEAGGGADVPISASLTAVASVAAPIGNAPAVAATLTAAPTLNGAFSGAVPLAASLDAAGTITGTINAQAALSASLTAVPTISVPLGVTAPMAATLAAVVILSAAINIDGAAADVPIAASLTAVPTLTADLDLATALASALTATVTLNASISNQALLTASLLAVPALSGLVDVRSSLSASLLATALLSAAITVPADAAALPTYGVTSTSGYVLSSVVVTSGNSAVTTVVGQQTATTTTQGSQ